MNPLPTLDAMLADPAVGKDRLTRAVEAAVQSVVAELTAIEAFDAASGPDSAYVFDRPVAATLRAAYEAWLAAAEPLEGRLIAAVARAGPIAGATSCSGTSPRRGSGVPSRWTNTSRRYAIGSKAAATRSRTCGVSYGFQPTFEPRALAAFRSLDV